MNIYKETSDFIKRLELDKSFFRKYWGRKEWDNVCIEYIERFLIPKFKMESVRNELLKEGIDINYYLKLNKQKCYRVDWIKEVMGLK